MPSVEMERRNLAKAEKDVAEGKRCIREQKRFIERLRGDGHDTTLAEQLFATLEDTLVQWVAHRDAILHVLIQAGVKSHDARCGSYALSMPWIQQP